MKYRRKITKRNNSKYFYSYNHIDENTEQVNLLEFLEHEFFECDNKTLQAIILHYEKQYGIRARIYMEKMYPLWKCGTNHITNLIRNRIIECIPKFLTPEKRLFILKCEIIKYLKHLTYQYKYQTFTLDNMNDIFIKIQNKIFTFDEQNIQLFIGKNIFQKVQIEDYLSTCKYILNEHLLQSYNQTINDLRLIDEKFKNNDAIITSAIYEIGLLGVKINLLPFRKYKLDSISLKNKALEIGPSFREHSEQYILNELIKISFKQKIGEQNLQIKSNDIDSIFNNYRDLSHKRISFNIKSQIQGEGGLLDLELKFTTFNKAIAEIIFSTMKISFLLIVLLIEGLIIYNASIIILIAIAILGGFFFTKFIVNNIISEIQKIKSTIKQVKW